MQKAEVSDPDFVYIIKETDNCSLILEGTQLLKPEKTEIDKKVKLNIKKLLDKFNF